MDYDTFKIIHSELIMSVQYIEQDLRIINSTIKLGNYRDNYAVVDNASLGKLFYGKGKRKEAMLDLRFEDENTENRIKAYIEAFQNAGISGMFHFPGTALSKDDGIPCVIHDATIFFTPYKGEAMHSCYAVVDELPVSMMAGLELASYHDFYEESSYAEFREGEWTVEI